jgi:hypothetical protein
MNKEARRLALEALEFISESGSMLGTAAEAKRLQAITALQEGLEVQQLSKQEPVARIGFLPEVGGGKYFEKLVAWKYLPVGALLYTNQPQEKNK